MHAFLLPLHSMLRWLVVFGLFYAVYHVWRGWKSGRTFESTDHAVGLSAVLLTYVQVFLGLWLYMISPIVRAFLNTYPESVHQRDIRFFGLEHIVMMLSAITVLTLGWNKAKRLMRPEEKFSVLFRWFFAAWLIIFLSIPWQFSPFTSRPYWRWF